MRPGASLILKSGGEAEVRPRVPSPIGDTGRTRRGSESSSGASPTPLEPTSVTTRKAKLRVCHECLAAILCGLDADWSALAVRIDPTPISQVGEAMALIAGRKTYGLWRVGGGLEITYRSRVNIEAGWRPYPTVHASHRCGESLPAAELPTPKTAPALTDRPPY